MKPRHLQRTLAIVSFFVGLTAGAGTYTWTGTGAWDIATNWIPNGVPGPGDRAVFVNGVGGICTVRTNQQVGSLAGTGTVALAGGDLFVGYDDTDALFAGTISGASNNLWKTGLGTLTLVGDCTYGGDGGATYVQSGTLTVNGTLRSYSVVVNGGTLNGSGLLAGDYDYWWGLYVVLNGGTLAGNLELNHEYPWVEVYSGATLGGNVRLVCPAGGWAQAEVYGGGVLRGSVVAEGGWYFYLYPGSIMTYDLTNAGAVGLTLGAGSALWAQGALAVNLGFAPTPGEQYTGIDIRSLYGFQPPGGQKFTNAPEGSVITASYGGPTYAFRVAYPYTAGVGAKLLLTSVGPEYTWQGTGAWNDPTNWAPHGVPGPADRAIFLSGTGGLCTAGDGTSVGSLVGTGTVALAGSFTVGGDNSSTEFGGTLQDAAGHSGRLVKTGVGTFTLTGHSTWSGSTTVSNGTLTVNGTVASAAIQVRGGAILAGTGVLAGALGSLQIASNATLGNASSTGRLTVAPATGPATASVSGTLRGTILSTNCNWILQNGARLTGALTCEAGGVTFNPGVTTVLQLYSTNALVPLTTPAVTGATLGVLDVQNNTDWSFTPNAGTQFPLIRFTAPPAQRLPATFANAPDGAVVTVPYGSYRQQRYLASYRGGDGNDAVLVTPAELLAYEPFNYPTGKLNAVQNGGTGEWSGAWFTPSPYGYPAVVTVPKPLGYTNGAVALSGGTNAARWNTSDLQGPTLYRQLLLQKRDLYFSFLCVQTNGTFGTNASLVVGWTTNAYQAASPRSGFLVGRWNGSAHANLGPGTAVYANAFDPAHSTLSHYDGFDDPAYMVGKVHFVVGKLTWNPITNAFTRVDMWINPDRRLVPSGLHSYVEAGVLISSNGFQTLTLSPWALGGAMLVDELRIGTGWEAVMPPPLPYPPGSMLQLR